MLQQIRAKLTAAEEEIRRSAVQNLRAISLDDSYPFLLQAMGDESWRVRKEAVDVFVAAKPQERHINAMMELFRSEDNAGQRNSAAEAVTRIGNSTLPALIQRLRDHDPDVRKFIIDVMGSIHSHECVEPLLSCLNDQDLNVASAAAEQLGNIGDNSAVPALLEAIVQSRSDFFRFNALAAIGKLAATLPVPHKITALASNDLLRKPLYECLGSIADETVLPLLMDGFSSKQKSCRNAAIVSWHRIYSRMSNASQRKLAVSLKEYKGSDLVPSIMDAYSHMDLTRSEAVVTLLDLIGDDRGVELFLRAFSIDRLAKRASEAIKHLYPESMARAINLYGAADESMRAAICMLCADCQYPEGIEIIRKGLCDSSPTVRQAAAMTAGRLGLLDVLQELVVLLDDDDMDVCNAAAQGLQSFAYIDRDIIQTLTNSLYCSEKPNRRRIAALLSATLGDGERLTLLVKDEDSHVRQAAVNAMKISHLAGVESILVMALVDEDPDVRIAAADAIGNYGSPELAKPLVSALPDNDVWVQCAILKNLVKIAPEAGFTQIERLFSTASGLLLLTSLQLLGSIASKEALAMVRQKLDDPDRDVAILANEIISGYLSNQVVA